MGGDRAPAGEEGQDGGAGPEQGQGVEEEIPDQRYQGQSREDQGPHYGGQDVARAVASCDHHDLAPYEERGDQRPEEHKRQVSRGEQKPPAAEYPPPPGTTKTPPPGNVVPRHSVPVPLYLAAPALKVPGHG